VRGCELAGALPAGHEWTRRREAQCSRKAASRGATARPALLSRSGVLPRRGLP
jgi:hypothetical protein